MPASALPRVFFELAPGVTVGARFDAEALRFNLANRCAHSAPMSQSELAAATGRSKQVISDYLSGRRAPSGEALEAIARALGLLPRQLLCDVHVAQQSTHSTLAAHA